MSRIQLSQDPFYPTYSSPETLWPYRGDWPATWVDVPGRSLTGPSVAAFRLRFTVAETACIRMHVSADNRYRLALDGAWIGRGPERGDPDHWRFESYEVTLAPGAHTITAFTWWLKDAAPFAQMTVRPGFLLAAEGAWQEVLSTGVAPWECRMIGGIEFLSAGYAWGTGSRVRVVGDAYPWEWADDAEAWQPVTKIEHATGAAAAYKIEYPEYWLLTPSTLPPMLEEMRRVTLLRHLSDGTHAQVRQADHLTAEAPAWEAWLRGDAPLSIPPHTKRRALLDLDDYCCAYPELTVSGGRGATIMLQWAESLYEAADGGSKGDRQAIEGKYFHGVGDVFLPDGGAQRLFTTLWWEAGRYLELIVETGDVPLTLDALQLRETRYPLEPEGTFSASDARLDSVVPLAVRALQMCAHETYMDCPYYEQMMYIGDTRLQVLVTYAITRDERLPVKALQCFNQSRKGNGLTWSRFPTRVKQYIPPFSLWWLCMTRDYLLWRGDQTVLRALLPGVREVAETFRQLLREDGLMDAPYGWNFMDWVHETWTMGIPPDAEFAPSGMLNLQYVLALQSKAELEAACGDALLAQRDLATAARIVEAVLVHFWDDERGLIADNLAKTAFSEHTQSLAIITGLLPEAQCRRIADGLLHDPGLARASIYFSHYLFEAFYALGLGDAILDRLSLWLNLADIDCKTTVEEPEPTRSDCHAWGAHPLYHFYASLMGIRPDGPGFATVRIAPQMGSLDRLEGRMPHPAGEIAVLLQRDGEALHLEATLPDGVTGTFCWLGETRALQSGKNSVDVLARESMRF